MCFVAAHKLPGDDGEFYQFCYVASNYQIRGASTPFQFRKPSADDFVEVEDEETNMLVIRSKTVLLQENLQHAESQKNKLIEVLAPNKREQSTPGPGCSKLTTSLVNVSLKFQRLISEVC